MTRALTKLAADLDSAESAIADGFDSHAPFDFEDENGRLQHRSNDCPVCRLHNARQAYFSAARVPVLRDREKLQAKRIRPDGATLTRYFDAMVEAQRYRSAVATAGAECGFTSREICDAHCAEEKAESDFQIFNDAFRAIIAGQAIARKRAIDEKARGIVRVFPQRRQRMRSL